jgi:hypothetical protein
VYIYTCIPESRGVHVYEYNWDIWFMDMYDIYEFICVYFQAGDWNIYICSQLNSMISCIYKMPVFTSSATKPFKRDIFIIYKVVDIVNVW